MAQSLEVTEIFVNGELSPTTSEAAKPMSGVSSPDKNFFISLYLPLGLQPLNTESPIQTRVCIRSSYSWSQTFPANFANKEIEGQSFKHLQRRKSENWSQKFEKRYSRAISAWYFCMSSLECCSITYERYHNSSSGLVLLSVTKNKLSRPAESPNGVGLSVSQSSPSFLQERSIAFGHSQNPSEYVKWGIRSCLPGLPSGSETEAQSLDRRWPARQ